MDMDALADVLNGIELNEKPKYLYHYTDAGGHTGILDQMEIRRSELKYGDCSLGEGVYFTSVPPQTGNIRLMGNNYSDPNADPAKVQFYFRIPAEEIYALGPVQSLEEALLEKLIELVNSNALEGLTDEKVRQYELLAARDVYCYKTNKNLDISSLTVQDGERKRFAKSNGKKK